MDRRVKHKEALDQANWYLCIRYDAGVWGTGPRMAALARMYDLTREPRYVSQLRAFIEQALLFRDDHHPGDICNSGRDLPPHPVDEFRGRTVPGWGGKSVNTGGLHGADEVISSVYAYPIAAFARIVAENAALHPEYGDDAVKYTNAVLETVWLFMPQIAYRRIGNFVEARLNNLEVLRTKPTPQQCQAAYAEALRLEPNADDEARDRYDRMLANCKSLHLMAGRSHAHNVNLAFAMVLIELSRVLDSPFYQQAPGRSRDAEPTRQLIPLLVARQQRYFANRLRTVTDGTRSARFMWNFSDDLPPEITSHPEDTSHGAVDMGYVELLRRDIERLNAVSASVGEPIAFDHSYLQRFARTFLRQIAMGRRNFARNVAGAAVKPPTLPDYYNGQCDGWINLAIADSQVYRVCQSVSLSVLNGAQPYLSVGNHSALLMNKQHAPIDVPMCPMGRKCCEPGEKGGCTRCVPQNAQCQ
jgi:hypothetical protein